MKTLLMVADSDHDANMLYAVGMFVPDPFIYLCIRGKEILVMSDLEIDRARKQAPHCHVCSLSQVQQKLRRNGNNSPGLADVVAAVLYEHRVRKVFVPGNFPYSLALDLRDAGIKVKPKPDGFFPEREEKSSDEVKKISAALMMAEVGLAEAMQALKSAKIAKNRKLIYHNAPLTSEKLRSIIDTAIMQANGLASHTIVAGGKQACDPHEAGYGPLKANEPIILDVFPRSQKTGYFGDITRTVVKGRASEAVRKLYDTVYRGQKAAFSLMRAGTETSKIHKAVQALFVREGYKTGKVDGRMQGFFHGTGHGLGLEIHEAPRVGATSKGTLKPGHVVTVEPGLYYPDIGGVRLEDVALVTRGAPRNLTQFEKVLEV
ncbi:MAG TPA: Xaa-Pro peptidase family protein [Verrucomicrobiae bacterium]|nr:Xaa-Pro peptidase family protein [Verrucomicrobiae bacterium]